jgi:hypothetical protein
LKECEICGSDDCDNCADTEDFKKIAEIEKQMALNRDEIKALKKRISKR